MRSSLPFYHRLSAAQIILLLFLSSSSSFITFTHGIFADEAGQNDFLISTAGHGKDGVGVSHAHLSKDNNVLTTFSEGGCYLTGRDVMEGTILWRRDVCSRTSTSNKKDGGGGGTTTMYGDVDKGVIYTMDHVGTVRSWNDVDGSLMDSQLSAKEFKPKAVASKNNCSSRLVIKDKQVYIKSGGSDTLVKGWELDQEEDLKDVHIVQCEFDSIKAVVTTLSGETHMIDVDAANQAMKELWMAEEALDGISSAIFLDVTHDPTTTTADEDENEEDMVLSSLSFSSRLESQLESVKSFVSGGFMEHIQRIISTNNQDASSSSVGPSAKDYAFGHTKLAVTLSNSFGKVIGIDTATKGKIAWTLNLNKAAQWHKIIHGAHTGKSSVFGHGMHHPHSHEILVLSQEGDSTVEWHCVDGVKGRVISKATIPISSSVSQILPIHAHSHSGGGCRQNAILIHEDDSVSVVPATSQSMTESMKAISTGLYSHSIDRESGIFRSMKVVKNPSEDTSTSTSGKAITVGETIFDPSMEKIINVVYPQRNEVVQSPTTILGDDSILLKYLNPHLCVVVTEATPTFVEELSEGDEGSESNSFYKALESKQDVKKMKKPLGATKPGESTTTTDSPSQPTKIVVPTLFINIVDTVSGHVLYRISHSHSLPDDTVKGSDIPVVISENWIIYAFPNARTRRTDIGVLTLHEGMIDKHGITAFSSPEQQLTFSSLTSPKPIVLAKTYSVAKPVSALGVTNTKAGISAKNILMATGVGGQIVRVDRRMLDPRRPSGEPKKTEKTEGLIQYMSLIPISPLYIPSYSNNVVDVKSIISTAANLESQTLTLAYGGPDIFFTRFAPSKGFDSLPESFNKLLLSLVLFALFIAMIKAKSMGDKKAVKFGWL